jgi:hypothetical protein
MDELPWARRLGIVVVLVEFEVEEKGEEPVKGELPWMALMLMSLRVTGVQRSPSRVRTLPTTRLRS